MEDGVGKEVVVVYKTEIRSNETFFTDSNGRQLVKRKRGERWENDRGLKSTSGPPTTLIPLSRLPRTITQ